MGITFFIRKLMMNAMGRNPENRSTFEGERSADGQKIFNPLWRLVSTMSEQAMIPHADAEAAGNPPQEAGYEKCLPGKEEQGCNCAYMKGPHEYGSDPIDFVVLAVAFERFDFQGSSPGFGINAYR
jgi:hypothetical protein